MIKIEKVPYTGHNAKANIYFSQSGLHSAQISISFDKLRAKAPERVIKLAVKGMLPRNSLGRAMFKKLKVYAGAEHPHTAQQPESVNL